MVRATRASDDDSWYISPTRFSLIYTPVTPDRAKGGCFIADLGIVVVAVGAAVAAAEVGAGVYATLKRKCVAS